MEEIIVGTKDEVELTPENSTAEEDGSRAAELDGSRAAEATKFGQKDGPNSRRDAANYSCG